MRKILLFFFVVALLFTSDPCMAQVGIGIGTGGIGLGFNLGSNRARPAKSLEREVQFLKQQLNLSTSQEAVVREAINEREQYRSRSQKQENYARFEQDMKDVLTPEQHVKYLEIREKRSQPVKKSSKKKDLPESSWDDVYN